MAGHCAAWLGVAGHGLAWQAWHGSARQGEARRGGARFGRHGWVWLSGAGLGWAALGMAGFGRQGRARLCGARSGGVGHGLARLGRRGKARHGMAWQGQTRLGKARLGKARQAWKSLEGRKTMVYRWEGYKYSVPAQTVGEICEQIEAEHGSVTKQALVDASRDADAPTHALFEWDNAIASEKWRCHQAGQVLSCLKITVFNKEGEQKPIRAYYNVSEEPTPRATYINIEKACLQADSMEVILRNALRELIAFKEKYKMLNTLKAVFDAIDQVTV